jgi:DNA-binding transcriptional MerR regulator
MNKILISAKELAGLLSLSKATIYAYAEKGIIKPVYMPSINRSQAKKQNRKAIRFTIVEVERFLKSLGVGLPINWETIQPTPTIKYE